VATKPDINAVWQTSWGVKPEAESLLAVEADRSKAPALWPDNSQATGFFAAPLLNAGTWLTLVKLQQPGALNPLQLQALQAIGFREGANGRLIHPGYPNPRFVDTMSKILRLPVDTLNPETVVVLKSSDQFKPAVPLEVQAGVRHFWKNRPDILAEEIYISLQEQRDNLTVKMLELIEAETSSGGIPDAFNNPLRLQVWVSQALSGEINAITESILSLGLQRGTMEYGPVVGDWPEDCQTLFTELAEFRGDDAGVETPLIPAINAVSDGRPGLRTPVVWVEDNTRYNGIVIGLPEDESELWVTPETQSSDDNGLPFFFPKRRRIPVSSIVEPKLPHAEQQSSEALGGLFAGITENTSGASDQMAKALFGESDEPEQAEALADQPAVRVVDLPNRILAQRESVGILQSGLQQEIKDFVASGNAMGQHPLGLKAGETHVDLVSSWRNLNPAIAAYHNYEQAMLDAEVIVRDELLERFNDAQPKTVGGTRSPLAVLPIGNLMRREAGSDTAMREALSKLNYCRVGLHPLLLTEIREKLQEWQNRDSQVIRRTDPTLAVHLEGMAFNFAQDSFDLTYCAFNNISTASIRNQVQDVYRSFYEEAKEELGDREIERNVALRAFERMGSDEGLAVLKDHLTRSVFPSVDEAQQFLEGRDERIAALADKNRSMFAAMSEVAGVEEDAIYNSRHPIMIVLDVIERNGLESKDRAETLARLNVDLAERMDWVGQLVALHGVSIDMAHTSRLREKPDEETATLLEGAGLPGHILRNGIQRLSATSGFLKVGYSRYPFQIALQIEENDLFQRQLTGRDMDINNQNLFVDSDFNSNAMMLFESIGRLVDLHRVSPIKFGPELQQKGQVITLEGLDGLEPSLYGTNDGLNPFFKNQPSNRGGLSVIPDLHPMPELIERGYSPVSEMSAFLRKNREILMTGTPAWRDKEGARRDLEDAVTLFVQDFKPVSGLARPQSLVASIIDDLVADPHAEQLVLAAKSSRSRVRWFKRVVTKEEIVEADNNRELATQHGIMKMKSETAIVRKNYQFATFDLAQTLRPEAIRYLNELRNKAPTATKDDETSRSRPRGARQDFGKVAGLAIKDLRGKSSVVIHTLADASAEDQKKFVTKTKLWEAPDWAFLRAPSDEDKMHGAKAMEPIVAAFFDEMRKRINPAPPANINDINQMYAKFVLGFRDQCDLIRTQDELHEAVRAGGALTQIEEELVTKAKDHGVHPHVIVGDEVFSKFYGLDGAFSGALAKARRRSRQNTQWDIKEAKPGTGRRPTVGLTQDQEIDAEDVENGLTGAMPMLTRLVREGGEDYRAGLDISEESIIKTFGFSGVEYGKSMSQNDRTLYLNEAYDGFMDLSKLLGVPPRALSLGGTLGLAFGSRGRGGRNSAAAHFEPQNNAINLTRMKGAGFMAHEYGHAFANYLFRISRGLEGSRAPGDITKTMVRQVATSQDVLAGNLRQPVADAVAAVLRNIKYQPVNEDGYRHGTLFVSGASNADAKDGRKEPYWNTIEELFARSFETYVHVALDEKFPGFRNDFLVRKDRLNAWGLTPHNTREASEKVLKHLHTDEHIQELFGDNPSKDQLKDYREMAHKTGMEMRKVLSQPQLYPGGPELKRIKDAFDHLFETLETKEQKVQHDYLGELDMPVLYSSGSAISERITQRDHAIIAECVMGEIARMCGNDVWVNFQAEIQGEDGQPVAGRYRKATSQLGQLHSVIDLAYNAGIHTAHHEAFHFAQDHLLENDEQSMLNRYFAVGSPLFEALREALVADGRGDVLNIIEKDPLEAQAYAYEQWVKGNLDVRVEEPPAGVFGRVNGFFDRVASLGRKSGFSTPEQLFQAFYQGKLQERQNQSASISQSSSQKTDTALVIEQGENPAKKSELQGPGNEEPHGDFDLRADDPDEYEDSHVSLRM